MAKKSTLCKYCTKFAKLGSYCSMAWIGECDCRMPLTFTVDGGNMASPTKDKETP